jgi:hypothetical protein
MNHLLCLELPEKHWLGNLSLSYAQEEKIELRRKELESYLNQLATHPRCWEEPSLHMFLGGCDNVFAEGKINLDSFRRYLNPPLSFNLEVRDA